MLDFLASEQISDLFLKVQQLLDLSFIESIVWWLLLNDVWNRCGRLIEHIVHGNRFLLSRNILRLVHFFMIILDDKGAHWSFRLSLSPILRVYHAVDVLLVLFLFHAIVAFIFDIVNIILLFLFFHVNIVVAIKVLLTIVFHC